MMRRMFQTLFLARMLGLIAYASDDGSGSGGGAGDSSGGQDDKGGGTDNSDKSDDSGAGDKPATVTMSQADLDALIDKRVGMARKGWEGDAKTAAERAKLDDAERAKAEKADAEKERDDAKREALATKVEVTAERLALAAKVDPSKVERFMRLVDLADIDSLTADGKPDAAAVKAAVEATLKDFPEFKAAAGGGRSGADFNGGGDDKPKSMQDAVARRMAS